MAKKLDKSMFLIDTTSEIKNVKLDLSLLGKRLPLWPGRTKTGKNIF